MPETDVITLFTTPLESIGLRYFITGSMAGMIYGEPRLTMDVDLVLELPRGSIKALIRAFDEDQFYCPPAESIIEEAARAKDGHFNLIHHETGFKAAVYLAGTDPLHSWAFSKRRSIELGDNKIWVAPPEYVILRKLEYYLEGKSEKHLRDIDAMIEQSPDEIDEPELIRMIEERQLQEVWRGFHAWRSF